jgi:uncharacterized protein YbjT (DUF2867 family)
MLRQDMPTEPNVESYSPVLVAGATGYVGDRLVPRLLARGYEVRALGRSRDKLEGRSWSDHDRLTVAEADVQNRERLRDVVEGCKSVYYLIHSLQSAGEKYREADRRAARNMVKATGETGVERLIYLGGLGDESDELSPHLQSRAEVARIFHESDRDTTVLRAGVILGSGSASFEILRYLVDRLPVMVTPRWVRTETQPIGIRNVLSYLVGSLETEETINGQFDIGGSDVLSYQELMNLYGQVAGLPRRFIIPAPVLTPELSSRWVHLVTPVPASIARPLIEGLKNPTVCREHRIRDLIPVKVLSARRAIELALRRIDEGDVESHWSDAGTLPAELKKPGDPDWAGGTVLRDRRALTVENDVETVWNTIIQVGGKQGWYGTDLLWKIRGWVDRLIGGVGHSRGRRNPDELQVGDALDFWRVKQCDRLRKLTLLAEMKLPGRATLSFELEELDDGRLRIKQTAEFVPSGLLGLLYWYLIYPAHSLVFNSMLRGIARHAEVEVLEDPDSIN